MSMDPSVDDDDDMSVGGGVWVESDNDGDDNTSVGKGKEAMSTKPSTKAETESMASSRHTSLADWGDMGVRSTMSFTPHRRDSVPPKKESRFARVPVSPVLRKSGNRLTSHRLATLTTMISPRFASLTPTTEERLPLTPTPTMITMVAPKVISELAHLRFWMQWRCGDRLTRPAGRWTWEGFLGERKLQRALGFIRTFCNRCFGLRLAECTWN